MNDTIKIGDIVETTVGRGILLNQRDNKYMLLLIDNPKEPYVLVADLKKNESIGKYEWSCDMYFKELSIASMYFDKITLELKKQINVLKSVLKQVNNFVRFAAIVENETEYDKKEITEFDLKKLDYIYDEFISNEDIHLFSDALYELTEDFSYKAIEGMVIDYLEENIENVDISKEIIDTLVKDVLYYCIENDKTPFGVIEYEEYFPEKVNKILGIEQETDVEEESEV